MILINEDKEINPEYFNEEWIEEFLYIERFLYMYNRTPLFLSLRNALKLHAKRYYGTYQIFELN